MRPTIARESHLGLRAEARPDQRRKAPPPWSVDLLALEGRVRHHALSRDGRHLAFLWDRDDRSDVWMVDPEQPQGWPQRLTFHRPAHTYWNDRAPVWDRAGSRLLAVIEDEIWSIDPATGISRPLTGYGLAAGSPLFSADGRRAFFVVEQEARDNLAWLPIDPRPGEWPVGLTHLDGDVGEPDLSPDGAWLAFSLTTPSDLNRSDICLVPASGGEVRRLTGEEKVQDRKPRWSPDGSRIAFLSNRSGWVELHTIAPAGGSVAPATQASAELIDFSWSPGGDRLAAVVNRQGNGRLELIDPNTRRAVVLRDENGWHARPQWAAGGDWMTVEFESPTRPPDIYRLRLEGERIVEETRLTDSRFPGIELSGLVVPQVVQYPSLDGTVIHGFLYRPARASGSNRRPAIVYPHGGPADSWALIWSLRLQWLVAKGYAVLAPDYRGSTGHGLAFQRALHGGWGTVDTEDVLAAADYLRGLDWIDGTKLGVVGSSYGSYLAVLALARDPRRRFRCGVAEYGDSDIRRSWATGDRIGREDLERQMGHPGTDPEGYRRGSPIHDAAGIQAPLLISHGAEDLRVHPRQSEELVDELTRQGKTFEFVVYEGEGHGILRPANRRDFLERLERFLDWHLM